MSSQGYATPLRLDGVALPALRRLYLLFCTLALGTFFWLPLPLLVKSTLLLLFVVFARRTWLTRPELAGPPVQLLWDASQRWWWSEAGDEHLLQLCTDSYLSRYFCVLNFRAPDKWMRRSLILMPAATGPQRYRQLLVRFRISADPLALDT